MITQLTISPQSWIDPITENIVRNKWLRPPIILPFPDPKVKYLYQFYERDFWVNTPYGDILIPFGLVTDGASIPRFLRSRIERDGMLRLAAQLHDLLFQCQGVIPPELWRNNEPLQKLDWKQCNWLYYWACIKSGVSEWDAQEMHIGLTIGSGRPWKRSPKKLDIRPPYYEIS